MGNISADYKHIVLEGPRNNQGPRTKD